MTCQGVFAHSMDKLQTVEVTKYAIYKRCPKCGFEEVLPKSRATVRYVNSELKTTKQFAYDDNRRELLQPLNADGSTNDEFTEAYGYNPFDPLTENETPKWQGGKKETI